MQERHTLDAARQIIQTVQDEARALALKMMNVMVSMRDELAEEPEESELEEEEQEEESSQQSNKFFGLESDSQDTNSVRYNGTVS